MTYLDLALGALEGQLDPRPKRPKRPKSGDTAPSALTARGSDGRCPDCDRFITEHGRGAESQCLRCPAWSRVIVPEIVMRACREGRRAFEAAVAAGKGHAEATEESEQAEERVLAGGGYRPRLEVSS